VQPAATNSEPAEAPTATELNTNVESVADVPAVSENTATPSSAPTSQVIQKKKLKLVPLLAVLAAVVLLGGGGAYGYFGVYMQTPENLWKQSVKNTGKGLTEFVNQPMPTQKGAKISGSFKLTTPLAADGTIAGSYDEKSTQITASAGASGVRMNLEVRGITEGSATSQDVYLKVDGLKAVSTLAGGDASEFGSVISAVDGKWYVIDHTLVDQAAASAKQSSDKNTPSPEELQKEAQELSKKVATILSERLFTADDSKAVVTIKEKLAKEDFKGKKSQHVKVQVQKSQLRDMIVALKDAVKDSKVNGWLSLTKEGKSFEDSIDFDSLLKNIDDANYDKAVADVWLDTSMKIVRNVRIDTSDSKTGDTSSLDFMLDYKGGDELPLSITLSGKDKSGDNSGSINLGMNINKKTYVIKLTAGVDGTFDKQKVQGSADLSVIPSGDKVTVEKPAGATNILELLGSFMNQTNLTQTQLGSSDFTTLLDDVQLQ
jgi:hypothetical protein